MVEDSRAGVEVPVANRPGIDMIQMAPQGVGRSDQ